MFRLALSNAPVQSCSRRALSSVVTRRPVQWARGRKYNSTKAGTGGSKKDTKLSGEAALRVDAAANPTVSSHDASKVGLAAGEKLAPNTKTEAANVSTSPSKEAAKKATIVEAKAKPTSKTAERKSSEAASPAPSAPKVATEPAPSTPIAAAQVASASLEASATPAVNVETVVDSTGQATSRVEPVSSSPVSELPPPLAEEVLETSAVEPQERSPKDAPTLKSKTKQLQEEVEEYDEDEDFEFENIDTTVEEATVKLLQSEEFMQGLQSGSVPEGPLETPDFGGIASTTEQPQTTRLRTREELGSEYTEAEWHSAIVHGRGVHLPFHHPRTHSVPAALIHFRSHSPEQLALFTHFAQHAAASLGIPCSGVASLPTKRTLWTVIKGPFAHKKTQENFERRVHKRAIKAWDAHPEVVDLWAAYLRRHAMGGVGVRVVKWTRAPVGVGQQTIDRVRKRMGKEDKVRKMGDEIVQAEMRRDVPAVEE